MTTPIDSNNPNIREGDHLDGYTVKRIRELSEIASFYYELEHTVTGAKLIHMSNKDSENTFGVAFKTVPMDSTGVAHILEHTALCGSRKYPVHDPFFSMLKRSLNTFMNAFTASDWTMYPFSTQNRKDFYNLMSVYLDAAFFPNLTELSFRQEGHRLEFDEVRKDKTQKDEIRKDTDPLTLVYKGIVYNEMKGAMSSPRDVLVRSLLGILYPETTYHHNSGGDPMIIPSLTYGDFKAFHRRHYHPSNAFFYTYGNLPLVGHLRFIHDSVLKAFERIDPQTDVELQPRWEAPRIERVFYPLEKNEDPSKKYQVCVAWLTADIRESFEVLVLLLLEGILLGNSASPLRKALIESGLGTALSDGTGFDPDNRDTLFACGLKDVSESSAEKIEEIIFETLRALVADGIDTQLIEAAIHQIEFHRKEITNTPYPYGLKLFLSLSGTWFHGGDPVTALEFETDLARLRKELSEGPILEDRIVRYFLDNPHRVRLTLAPDPTMAQRENERVSEELDLIRSRLTDTDIQEIRLDSEALEQLQDREEDVSSLPTLEITDIPNDITRVEETDAYSAIPATCYAQPTAGIFYFSAGVGAGLLQRPQLPFVPFFCFALPRIGTALHDYEEMARRIDASTGGIGLNANARTGYQEPADCVPYVSFNGKCLVRNQERMFGIIEELFCQFDFSDLSRLKNLLLEYRASLESMVVPSGHRLAMSLASRNFTKTSALNETWHGVEQLKTIKELAGDLSEGALGSFSETLCAMGRVLFVPDNLRMALIGEGRVLEAAAGAVDALEKGLSKMADADPDRIGNRTNGFNAPEIEVKDIRPREGWSTSSAVSFVASTFPTARLGHEDAPAMAVIGKMLRSLYIHREIREKGGAYGGYAMYSTESGLFSLASYRDPHIVATLSAFDGATSFIRSGNYTDEDVKEAILQVCSDIDTPDPPGPGAIRAFARKIVSLSDETRMDFKKQLLTLTREKVLHVAEKYFEGVEDKAAVAVISETEKLEAANEKLSDRPLALYKI